MQCSILDSALKSPLQNLQYIWRFTGCLSACLAGCPVQIEPSHTTVSSIVKAHHKQTATISTPVPTLPSWHWRRHYYCLSSVVIQWSLRQGSEEEAERRRGEEDRWETKTNNITKESSSCVVVVCFSYSSWKSTQKMENQPTTATRWNGTKPGRYVNLSKVARRWDSSFLSGLRFWSYLFTLHHLSFETPSTSTTSCKNNLQSTCTWTKLNLNWLLFCTLSNKAE